MTFLQTGASVESVAHVIDLAVAPVFLISGVAAMLAVLTNRLGRIIDRARRLEDRLPDADAAHAAVYHHELTMLARRARFINLAISLCTTSALLVCMVIGALFLAAFLAVDVSAAIATLFVAAMVMLIGALLSFLREVFLATATLRIGPH